jgi:hypothetical protein
MTTRFAFNRASKVATGVCLLAVLIVALFLILDLDPFASLPSPKETASSAQPKHSKPLTIVPPPEARPPLPRSESPPEVASPVDTSFSRPELTLVDTAGSAVPHVIMDIQMLDIRALIRARSRGENEPEPASILSLTSDAQGRVSFELPEHQMARVRIVDKSWRLQSGQDGYQESKLDGQPELLLGRPTGKYGEWQRQVILQEQTQLTVDVCFENGTPFTGRVVCSFSYKTEVRGAFVD